MKSRVIKTRAVPSTIFMIGVLLQAGSSKEIQNMQTQEQPTLAQHASNFIDSYLTPKLSTPIIATPADYGMDYEEVSYQTPDGVQISAWLIKGGKQKVLIQAHPVTANRSGFLLDSINEKAELLKTAKAFVDAGYSVLAFDARNHGKSDIGPTPFIIGTIDDAPDFVAAVDYITSRSEFKDSKIGIHAVCFGANATASGFGLEDGLQNRKNLAAISLTQPASWGMLLRNNPAVPDVLVDEINSQLIARGSKDIDLLPLDYAKKITVPTMILQNQNDPHFTKSFIDDFYAQIPGEKELRWVDGRADRSDLYLYETKQPSILVEWFEKHMTGTK